MTQEPGAGHCQCLNFLTGTGAIHPVTSDRVADTLSCIARRYATDASYASSVKFLLEPAHVRAAHFILAWNKQDALPDQWANVVILDAGVLAVV